MWSNTRERTEGVIAQHIRSQQRSLCMTISLPSSNEELHTPMCIASIEWVRLTLMRLARCPTSSLAVTPPVDTKPTEETASCAMHRCCEPTEHMRRALKLAVHLTAAAHNTQAYVSGVCSQSEVRLSEDPEVRELRELLGSVAASAVSTQNALTPGCTVSPPPCMCLHSPMRLRPRSSNASCVTHALNVS
jgi:hypothetical protein